MPEITLLEVERLRVLVAELRSREQSCIDMVQALHLMRNHLGSVHAELAAMVKRIEAR